MSSKSIDIAASGITSFFLWLSNILSHNFFIHSIDGPIGYFHILNFINNASVNIEVHVFFLISVFFFSPKICECGIYGSYSSFSIFSETFILFSIVAALISVPISSAGGFFFLDILAIICYLWLCFALLLFFFFLR